MSSCTELSNLIPVNIEVYWSHLGPCLTCAVCCTSCWQPVLEACIFMGMEEGLSSGENCLYQLNGEPWLTDSSLLHHPGKETFMSFQNYDTLILWYFQKTISDWSQDVNSCDWDVNQFSLYCFCENIEKSQIQGLKLCCPVLMCLPKWDTLAQNMSYYSFPFANARWPSTPFYLCPFCDT